MHFLSGIHECPLQSPSSEEPSVHLAPIEEDLREGKVQLRCVKPDYAVKQPGSTQGKRRGRLKKAKLLFLPFTGCSSVSDNFERPSISGID